MAIVLSFCIDNMGAGIPGAADPQAALAEACRAVALRVARRMGWAVTLVPSYQPGQSTDERTIERAVFDACCNFDDAQEAEDDAMATLTAEGLDCRYDPGEVYDAGHEAAEAAYEQTDEGDGIDAWCDGLARADGDDDVACAARGFWLGPSGWARDELDSSKLGQVGALDAAEAEAAFVESFRTRWEELTGGDDEDC